MDWLNWLFPWRRNKKPEQRMLYEGLPKKSKSRPKKVKPPLFSEDQVCDYEKPPRFKLGRGGTRYLIRYKTTYMITPSEYQRIIKWILSRKPFQARDVTLNHYSAYITGVNRYLASREDVVRVPGMGHTKYWRGVPTMKGDT